MLSKDRFMAACRGEKVDRPPVWLMRQAGRYLPEYREIKKDHSFWDIVRSPNLAFEVSMQPLNRFEVDAAIVFSDILIVLDSMGASVSYDDGGPSICPMVRHYGDCVRLSPVDATMAFDYVGDTVRALAHRLHPDKAVIGFAGAPFTLASYLVEQGPNRSLENILAMYTEQRSLYEEIIAQISDVIVDLLALQVEAGADVVQIFDTWAGKLDLDQYVDMALPAVKRVIERTRKLDVPVIMYSRNSKHLLEAAASSGCDVLSIDCSLSLEEARARLGPGLPLQGNMDPAILKKPADEIKRAVTEMIRAMEGTGYIVNLGQGLVPDIPVEGVEAFVDAVRTSS